MSRSYRKNPCQKNPKYIEAVIRNEMLGDDRGIPNWPKTRMKENRAVHDELTNQEYGDAVFPKYRGADKSSWVAIQRGGHLEKEYIRIGYFEEIRDILNGYHDEKHDYEELFIKAYNRIKNGESPEMIVRSILWRETFQLRMAQHPRGKGSRQTMEGRSA